MTGSARRVLWWLLTAALSIALLGVAGLATWRVIGAAAVPPAESASERQAVMDVAKNGVVKILTYSSDTVEQDVAAALDLTTGKFHDYYQSFSRDTVIPTAKRNQMTTKATVERIGLESLTRESAVLVAFVNQSTTQGTGSEPSLSTSAVRTTLQQVNGKWLIAALDPL